RMQVQTIRRASGPDARLDAELIERDEHDGPVIFFGESPGDQANYTGVPAAAGQDQRRITFGIELFFDLLRRREVDAAFQALTTAVELVNVFGKLLGAFARVSREQLD